MSERLGLLAVQERHAHRVYEGAPVKLLDTNVSLPPPQSTPPKAPPKPPRLAHNRLTDDEARAIWNLRDAGHTKVEIARATGRSTLAVDRVLSEDRPPEPAPAPAAAEKEKDAEAPLSLVPKPDQAPPDPATPDPATPDLPYHAIASPKADEPAMSTTCGPQLGYQEPVRTFVIDWKAKFDRMEFTSAPANCLPKKGRSRGKGFTHHQVQQLLRSNHAPTTAMDINSERQPKPVQSQTAVQSIAQLFGGGGGC